MTVIEKGSGGYTGPDIEDDIYTLTVIDTEVKPHNNVKDKYNHLVDRLRITFGIDEYSKEDEVTVDALPPLKLSDGNSGQYPASALWNICIALGMNPEQLERLDTEDMLGLKCRAHVFISDTGWPRCENFTKVSQRGRKNGSVASQEGQEPSQSSAVDKEIVEWWKRIENMGFSRKEVIDKSQDAYGLAPWEITAEVREELYSSLIDPK